MAPTIESTRTGARGGITAASAGAATASTLRHPLSAPLRLLYLDNLRILLITLVILTHLAIAYGAPVGDWYYDEEGEIGLVPAILMVLFLAINQSFFMGLFFMISAYFTPPSCDRKGAGRFLVDRLQRLGIPMLFYALAINPVLACVLRAYHGSPVSFEQFLARYSDSVGVGPLWFVEALLVFSLVYLAGRRLVEPGSHPLQSQVAAPENLAIALFALALGGVTFLVRIWVPVGWWFEPLHLQLAHFPQYVALFVVGLVAYRRGWLAGLSDAQARPWLWMAIALVPVFPAVALAAGAQETGLDPFMGGLHWQSLVFSLWEQAMGAAMIVTLLAWFRGRFNRQGALARAMSGASYAVYVLHPPVLVLLGLALAGIRMDLALKFLLLAPVAVSLSFLAGHYARKLPLAREVL